MQPRAETDPGAVTLETTAESQNTDPDQGRRSPSDDHKMVSVGIQLERSRLLKKLGVESYDELAELVEQFRNKPVDTEPKTQPSDNPEFVKLGKEYGQIRRDFEKAQRDIEVLRGQADEARLEKLRSAALQRGVGPGLQLEAFVRLYGDRVRFSETRDLEVMDRLPDGTMAPLGRGLDDFVSACIEESKFLMAPEGRHGGGSSLAPTRAPEPGGSGIDLKRAFGANGGGNEKLDRIFGRSGK
jgi:hypothetical protein